MRRMKRLAAVATIASLTLVSQTARAQAGMLSVSAQGQYVEIPDSPALVPATGFTIEAWIYFANSFPVFAPTVVRKSDSYILRLENGGSNLVCFVNRSGIFTSLNAPIANVMNAWHHVAATYDGAVMRVYLDAVQVGNMAAPGTLTNVPGILKIGEGSVSQQQFTGKIDEVRLWSVVRTAQQLQADRFRELGPKPGLEGAWRMNGDFNDSANTHHGSAVGGATTQASTSPVFGNYVLAPAFAPIGSPLVWNVTSSESGSIYAFDFSVTGTSPGIVLGPPFSATVPLNLPWIHHDYGPGLPPGWFTDFVGVVPASHVFHPAFSVPDLPALVGLPISATFVTLNPLPPGDITAIGAPSQTILGSAAPVIQSIVPAVSRQSGGIAVTITGLEFQPGATVSFDGALATNVVVTPTSISLSTPSGALGPADVKITNPDGVSTTLAGGLTYVADLVVGSVTPEPPVPGAPAILSGSGFAPGLTLSVGGTIVTPTQIAANAVTFVMPQSIPCDALVAIVSPDQQSGYTTCNVSPVISQLFPGTGSHLGGSTFFIFGSFTPGAQVSVGGTGATILGSTSTAILVEAPPGPVGFATVLVTTPYGCSAAGQYLYQ